LIEKEVLNYNSINSEAAVEIISNVVWWKRPALVCGYRVYKGDSSSVFRRIFHWGFRTTVQTLFLGTALSKVRDTQCGCKLMTAAAAQQLYSSLHLRRWSHDVEVLCRAVLTNNSIALTQAPVPWQDCKGSRLAAEGVLRVALRMFWDICYCRFAYAVGWWKVRAAHESW